MLTLTARGPDDVLAAVPVVLGFEPEESVVMLTFGGRHAFHARVDLPRPEHHEELARLLLQPCLRHRVPRVVLVLYTGDARSAARLARQLVGRFARAGVRVVECLRVHDGRWFDLRAGGRPTPHGVPFESATHPFRVRAVVAGEVVAGSRAELAARLRQDEAAARRVATHLEEVEACDGDGVVALVERSLGGGPLPDDREAAALLLGLRDPLVCSRAWWGLRRDDARERLPMWTDLVRRAPSGFAADAAAVLAFTAWMGGDGALAWCGVDRCRAEQSDHGLAQLVDEVITAALPPAEFGWPPAPWEVEDASDGDVGGAAAG